MVQQNPTESGISAGTNVFSLPGMSDHHWAAQQPQAPGQISRAPDDQPCLGQDQGEHQPYHQGLLPPQLFEGGE